MAEASTKPKSTRAQDETALKIDAIRKQVEFQRKQDEAQLKLREQQAQNQLKQQALQQKAQMAQRGFQEDQVLQAGENQLMDQAAAADEQGRPLPEIPDPGQLNMADPLGGLARQPGLGAGGFLEAAQQLSGGAGAQQRLAQMQGRGAGGGGQVTIGGQQYPTSGGTIDTTTTETTARPANALEILFGKGPGMVQTGQTTRVTSEPDVLTQAQVANLQESVRYHNERIAAAQQTAAAKQQEALDIQAQRDGEFLANLQLLGRGEEADKMMAYLQQSNPEMAQQASKYMIGKIAEVQLDRERQALSHAPAPTKPTFVEQLADLQTQAQAYWAAGDTAGLDRVRAAAIAATKGRQNVSIGDGGVLEFNDKPTALSVRARGAEASYTSAVIAQGMLDRLIKGYETGSIATGYNATFNRVLKKGMAGLQAIKVGGDLVRIALPGTDMAAEFTQKEIDSFVEDTRQQFIRDKAEYGVGGHREAYDIWESALSPNNPIAENFVNALQYQLARANNGPGNLTRNDKEDAASRISLGGVLDNPSDIVARWKAEYDLLHQREILTKEQFREEVGRYPTAPPPLAPGIFPSMGPTPPAAPTPGRPLPPKPVNNGNPVPVEDAEKLIDEDK